MPRPKLEKIKRKPGIWMSHTPEKQFEYQLKNLDRIVIELRERVEKLESLDWEERFKRLEGYHG